MKMFQKLVAGTLLGIVLTFCVPVSLLAQPGGTTPPDPCTDPALPCPIDGGVTLLLAIGAIYGITKYTERGQANKTPEPVISNW